MAITYHVYERSGRGWEHRGHQGTKREAHREVLQAQASVASANNKSRPTQVMIQKVGRTYYVG